MPSTLIVDMGQSETKYALTTSKEPSVIPTVLAFTYPHSKKSMKTIIGSDAIKLMKQKRKVGESDQEMTVLRYPFQNGRVMDWDHVEQLYQHILKSGSASTSTPTSIIVTSDPIAAPLKERQQLCEILVEKFGIQQIVFEASGILNMRQVNSSSSNKQSTSGVAVHSGVSYTSMIPMLNNKPLYDKAKMMTMGGSTISAYLYDLLRQSCYTVEPAEIHRVAEHVKKNMAYCAVDFQREMQDLYRSPKDFAQELELGTGEKLMISQGETFKCVEPLFNPELIGNYNASSMQKTLYDVVESNFTRDEDKRALYSNIVLSGGNCLLMGIKDRLSAELQEGLKQSGGQDYVDLVNVDYVSGDAESEGVAGAWYGAQQWAQDASKGKSTINWITKSELADQGKERIVKSKCY